MGVDTRKTPLDTYLEFFRDVVPTITREVNEHSRESVQTLVWLAGLGVALLTFSGAYPRSLSALTQSQKHLYIGLLVSVVILAVVQRVLHHIAEGLQRNHLYGMRGALFAITGMATPPQELFEGWNCAEIVAAIKTEFDVDYSFLLTPNQSVDECRKAYRAQYDLWHSQQEDRAKSIGRLIGAYLGKGEKSSEDIFTGAEEVNLGILRRKGRIIRGLYILSSCFVVLAACVFISAVSLLALAGARQVS
jgi:hypothetical protein